MALFSKAGTKPSVESVHQLLEDQIKRLGLQGEYEIQKAEIKHRYRQTSFTFHGLRDQSVHNIKSLEGADILWVEEAQNVSKKSWRTVIPTIRKPGSEIWVLQSRAGVGRHVPAVCCESPAGRRGGEDELSR